MARPSNLRARRSGAMGLSAVALSGAEADVSGAIGAIGALGALGAVGALATAPGNGRGTAPDVAHAADDNARAIIVKTAGAKEPALSAVEGRIRMHYRLHRARSTAL